MPIAVNCPDCAKQYYVKDELAGRRIRCPNGHVLLVPQPSVELDLGSESLEAEAVPNATMPVADGVHNPYASPSVSQGRIAQQGELPVFKVGMPAVALIILGSLGFILSILSAIYAVIDVENPVDPNAPPIVQSIQAGSRGPLAVAVQIGFVFVNALIVVGAIQMLRFRAWGLALVAAILAMVNFGNCCCVPGIPVGIWSIVVLTLDDVREGFRSTAG